MAKRFYQFGPFCIDAEKRVLLREKEVVPVTPKAFDMLVVLVQRHGQVLEKRELLDMLWPDSDVEEANLPQNISALRKALGETPNERHYIVTIPGRGYRFAGDVREFDGEGESVIVERYKKSSLVIDEPSSESPRASKVFVGSKLTIAVGAVVLIILGLGVWFLTSEKPVLRPPVATIESLAVLPFKQLGGERDEYIGLGIADSLITRLSNLDQIKVRPTSSVLKYTNQPAQPSQVGGELGVDAILEGSIRRDGESVRVTVQLVNVKDGSSLWASKFDDRFTGIFTIEDAISARVAESLVPKLRGEELLVLAKRYTENSEAYYDYLKGRFFWNKRTKQGMEKAIELFENAVARDQNYALAYAGLSDSYAMLYQYDSSIEQNLLRARASAIRGLQIDPTLCECHTSLAFVLLNEGDTSAAETELKKAIELNPNYATAYQRYSTLLQRIGRSDEALQMVMRARELDPLSLIINTAVGSQYYMCRRYDEAIKQLQKTLELDPNFIHAHSFLGAAYLKKGMYDGAIREIEKAKEISGNSPTLDVVTYQGYIYGVTGKRAEAKTILKDALDLRKRYLAASHIALIYSGLGETGQAFTWLSTAYKGRELDLGWLNNPALDSLREDSRFADLVRRVGASK